MVELPVRIMCQLCFIPVTIDELHSFPDGTKEDVCWNCTIEEEKTHAKKNATEA